MSVPLHRTNATGACRRSSGGRALRVAALCAVATLAGCAPGTYLWNAYHGCAAAKPIAAGPDRIVEGRFRSAVLGRDVAYAIAFPKGPARALVFMIPGRGMSAHHLIVDLGFSRSLYASGWSVPFAIASMDPGETYWHHRVSGENVPAAFAREFEPLAERIVRRAGGLPPTASLAEAVAGDSMGGYAALLEASAAPARYRAVAVASPAIWPVYPGPQNDAFDSADDYARNDIFLRGNALRRIPMRVDGADHDPFRAGIDALVAIAPQAVVGRRPGCHDDAFFTDVIPDQLALFEAHFR